MEDAAEVRRGGAGAFEDCTCRAGATGMLGRDASCDAQFTDCRNVHHQRRNESLADSEQIAEVVSKIKDSGYDIFLVLEATIGVSKPGEKSDDKTSLVTTLTTNPEFKISDQDLKFLKSLRIKIENDAA